MKRNSLTTALLAGLAGAAGLASTAQAVNLNTDGIGQVLIYPYYTVNKGNHSLFSVVNTTSKVKAVKVRFREGYNSREVLDFNLYLSPFDVWVGSVFAATGSSGPASISTPDKSCTVPAIGTSVVPFRTFAFDGTVDDTDGGPTDSERTREGYVEMIEMGEVGEPFASNATHNAAGTPKSCGVLVDAWSPGGAWANNSANAISIPNGGLYGAGTIFDVANGTLHAYNADAIEGFYTNTAAPAALHFDPGSLLPNLSFANTIGNVATSYVFTSNGTLNTSNWTKGRADAVSALYMHDAIYNEYYTDPALGAASEWVVTFPTKNFYVDALESAEHPFTKLFNGAACEPIDITYWNREEAKNTGSVDFSPSPRSVTSLCYEAQVITFNQEAAAVAGSSLIFGSALIANINTKIGGVTANAGHAKIGFAGTLAHELTSNNGVQFKGLPVTGFWSANYVNSQAQPGKLANFSGAYRHRASRIINILG